MIALIPDNNKILEIINYQKKLLKFIYQRKDDIILIRNFNFAITIPDNVFSKLTQKEIPTLIKKFTLLPPKYNSKKNAIVIPVEIKFNIKNNTTKPDINVLNNTIMPDINVLKLNENFYSELLLLNNFNKKNPLENELSNFNKNDNVKTFPMEIKIFKIASTYDLSINYSNNVKCTKTENLFWINLN